MENRGRKVFGIQNSKWFIRHFFDQNPSLDEYFSKLVVPTAKIYGVFCFWTSLLCLCLCRVIYIARYELRVLYYKNFPEQFRLHPQFLPYFFGSFVRYFVRFLPFFVFNTNRIAFRFQPFTQSRLVLWALFRKFVVDVYWMVRIRLCVCMHIGKFSSCSFVTHDKRIDLLLLLFFCSSNLSQAIKMRIRNKRAINTLWLFIANRCYCFTEISIYADTHR